MSRPSTPLGKFLKHHCIENTMVMTDLANEIGIAQSYMSAVNLGLKGFPDAKIDRTIHVLKLSETDQVEFRRLVEDWKTSFSFYVVGMPDEKRVLVARLVRKFDKLSDDEVKNLYQILQE